AGDGTPESHRLLQRAQNLGLLRWTIWARGTEGSVLEDAVDPAIRCLVVDLGSLGTHAEQALAAEAVLSRLWERRSDRSPVLVVLDEAHNVCPAAPGDPLTALATEHAVRIAGEGRKVRDLHAGRHPASTEGARERHLAVRQPHPPAAQLGRRQRLHRR